MFWGKVLKEGEPYKVQHALEDGDYPVLHLSNAVLSAGHKSQSSDKTIVNISMGKEIKNLQIAVLSPEKREVQPLDLYLNISQDITISVKGKSEVHLSGYFEPNNSLDDQMYGGGPMELDDEEEGEEEGSEDSDDDVQHIKKMKDLVNGDKKKVAKDVEGFKQGGDLDKSLKAASKNTKKNAVEVESDSDDEEDESDLDDDFMGIPGLDLEAEEGEDEAEYDEEVHTSDEEEDEVLQKLQSMKKKTIAKSAKKQAVQESSDEESSDDEPVQQKKAAPAKAPVSDVSDSEDSDDSENDLQALLKKKQIAQKVQKVDEKKSAPVPQQAKEQESSSKKKHRKRSKKNKK